MKKLFLLILLAVSYDSTTQTLPIVSEPVVNVLYRFYPNLVQLRISNDDYNEYILVNDSCEVLLHDKKGSRLAPNNFIINLPSDYREDSIHFRLYNRSDMRNHLGIYSFDVMNPPLEVIYLDGILEGGSCSRRPLKLEAKMPEEAPVRLIYEIEFWTMEIGDTEVFGENGKFGDYAYSVLSKLPLGTEIKFRCRILNEKEYYSYHEAIFYLE